MNLKEIAGLLDGLTATEKLEVIRLVAQIAKDINKATENLKIIVGGKK